MLGFILFGAISFFRLGVGQYPDVDVPIVSVEATLEGAAPEIVESEVVDVLEDAVMSVEGVKGITSKAEQGKGSVTVEFDVDRDIDLAVQDIQAKVSAAQRYLPTDIEPPVIRKTNPEDRPIMWVALTGARSPQELSDLTRNVLRDKFLTVPGNGDVMMGGYLERNLRVWIDPHKLRGRNLTVEQVIGAIERQHLEVPAGRIEAATRESNLRVQGEAMNLAQWRDLVIDERDGAVVQLKDVALVEDGFEDRRRIARINGMPAQGMGIIKQHGANTVELANAVRERVAELNRTLPEDLELSIRFDSSKYIEAAIYETEETLWLAVFLTALVCWIFLGRISPTFNVVLAIPVSVLGTFAVMYFLNFTLNTFTLLALSLSVGIIVDDAIMVLENIYRHGEMGKDRVTAARVGAEQIAFAALATTMAIVAIFLPVAFMHGTIGRFFFQFGVVLSVAVFISLLEALTLTPSRCAQFLAVGGRRNVLERGVGWCFAKLTALYALLLRGALRWRLAVLGAAVVFFAISLLPAAKYLFGVDLPGVPQLTNEMVPLQDQSVFRIQVKTPVGSSIEYTDGVMRQVEEIVNARPEIASMYAIIGDQGNEARAFVAMVPREQREKSQQEVIAELRRELNRFPGTSVRLQDPSSEGLPGGRGSRDPVAFSIRGPDWDRLGRLSEEIAEAMTASGKLVDVNSDYEVGMPEVRVTPNRTRTLAHNVDIAEVSRTIQALMGGTRVAKFTREGRRYDVRVRLLREDRLRPEDIEGLYVPSKDGNLVRLADLVDVTTQPSLQSITRQDRERAVTVTAGPAPGVSQGDALREVEVLAAGILPDGYRIVFTGQSQAFMESEGGLLFALLLGIVVAYMILASQFNSFIHPFTILLALPFSISGALAALVITGQTINIYSAIGLILLTGIAKKNSILLVEFTNQAREAGKSCDDALREACPVRLRPILMTSCATIAGAIPGALAGGAGAELRIPMSVTVIGGMIVSTLLTLLVVPCFYSLADEVRTEVLAIWHKRFPPVQPVEEPSAPSASATEAHGAAK